MTAPDRHKYFRIVARICLIMAAIILVLLAATSTVFAEPLKSGVQEAITEYTEFATYDAGIILPAQITEELFDAFVFIDTRTAEEFAQGTIKGATHIEWRDIFSRLDDIPQDQKTVLFCNTGALSAQSAFGLRVLGYDNVLVLQGGFRDWMTQR